MQDIEAFLLSSQQTVSDQCCCTASPYRFELEGIRSDNDLMQTKFGKYGEMNTAWNAEEAKGLSKCWPPHLKCITL